MRQAHLRSDQLQRVRFTASPRLNPNAVPTTKLASDIPASVLLGNDGFRGDMVIREETGAKAGALKLVATKGNAASLCEKELPTSGTMGGRISAQAR